MCASHLTSTDSSQLFAVGKHVLLIDEGQSLSKVRMPYELLCSYTGLVKCLHVQALLASEPPGTLAPDVIDTAAL
jgi:hypothetical protein